MPKISSQNDFVEYSDPRTWSWEYPFGIKKIGDLHLAVDEVQQNKVKYGLFKSDKLDPSDCVSGIEMNIIDGSLIGLKAKKVPVISMVSTVEEERSKGLARILYKEVLNKYKIIMSDKELFSDDGVTNKTLSIWMYYLPTLGKMLLYDVNDKKFLPFDYHLGKNDEDMRFVVIKDEQILDENWKTALSSMALGASLLSTPAKGMENPANTFASFATASTMQPQQNQPLIDINVIAMIESTNNPNAINKITGARGLCQITRATWDEETKKLYGKVLPFDQAFDPNINRAVAYQYYNVTIPKFLNTYGIPITVETCIGAYNAGIGTLKKLIKKYGSNNWITGAKKETQTYIKKYYKEKMKSS